MATIINYCLKPLFVLLAFCTVLIFGALKSSFVIILAYIIPLRSYFKEISCSNVAGVVFGPIAALILILGNVGVILGLFPAHVAWTVYTLFK